MKWGGSAENGRVNATGLLVGLATMLVILGGLALLASYGWMFVAP